MIAESALLAVFHAPPASWALTPFRVDWGAANPPPLDTTSYESTTTYDALNRIMAMQYPDSVDGARKLLTPQYNAAGALESLALDGNTYVERIAYNAKGQRMLIAYGNGQMTRYAYDPQTFRVLRMRTESYTKPSASTYHPSAPATPLQEFGYAYDLAGNVLTISDRTQGSGIQNSVLGTDALNRNFIYDPVYRLISATGRECDVPPLPPPWDDTPRCADITKALFYRETYQYDKVGNIALWNHTQIDSSGNASGTNRQFSFVAGSNQLSQLTIGSTSCKYAYDASGNLVQENTERHFEWDESDRMRVFRIQPDGAPPSIYTQYLYDGNRQRVMKLTRNQGGGYETTVYINGVFEVRSTSGAITIKNNLLHVMDNKSRVAIVRVGNALPDDGTPDVPIQYQFGDHLGSSNVVVDDTGAWINREEYLPYGETSFGSFARKRYRFTGKERDEESGLYYHGARYYAPWLARWTSCDPAGMTDGPSLYVYARSHPMRLVDQTGKQAGVKEHTPEGSGSHGKTEGKVTGVPPPPVPPEKKNVLDDSDYAQAVAYRTKGTRVSNLGGFLALSPHEKARLLHDEGGLEPGKNVKTIAVATSKGDVIEKLPSMEEVHARDVNITWDMFMGSAQALTQAQAWGMRPALGVVRPVSARYQDWSKLTRLEKAFYEVGASTRSNADYEYAEKRAGLLLLKQGDKITPVSLEVQKGKVLVQAYGWARAAFSPSGSAANIFFGARTMQAGTTPLVEYLVIELNYSSAATFRLGSAAATGPMCPNLPHTHK